MDLCDFSAVLLRIESIVKGFLIDNLGGEGYQRTKSIARKLGEDIVNALHLGQRSRASDLLSQLDSGDRALKLKSFVPILEYCAKAPDPMVSISAIALCSANKLVYKSKLWMLVNMLRTGGRMK